MRMPRAPRAREFHKPQDHAHALRAAARVRGLACRRRDRSPEVRPSPPVARPLDAGEHADRGGGAFVIGTILRSTGWVLMDRRSRLRRLVVLAWVTAVVVPDLAATPPAVPIPALNQKVLEFARERIGEKVADGQCTSLAVEALRYAGAKRYPFDSSGDFVWGRPVASFQEGCPATSSSSAMPCSRANTGSRNGVGFRGITSIRTTRPLSSRSARGAGSSRSSIRTSVRPRPPTRPSRSFKKRRSAPNRFRTVVPSQSIDRSRATRWKTTRSATMDPSSPDRGRDPRRRASSSTAGPPTRAGPGRADGRGAAAQHAGWCRGSSTT